VAQQHVGRSARVEIRDSSCAGPKMNQVGMLILANGQTGGQEDEQARLRNQSLTERAERQS
jgi:hypothetical protein